MGTLATARVGTRVIWVGRIKMGGRTLLGMPSIFKTGVRGWQDGHGEKPEEPSLHPGTNKVEREWTLSSCALTSACS